MGLAMTKVTLHYKLTRPLTDADYENIAAMHSTWGMSRVRADGDQLLVDYDASRLMKSDVEHVIARHGVPVATPAHV
jgi:hypothetical protein